MLLLLKSLPVFETVARLNKLFRGAAQELNVSQSAVSHSNTNHSKTTFGNSLFHRLGRNFRV